MKPIPLPAAEGHERPLLAALAVATALLLGGCGNGEDETADTGGEDVAIVAESERAEPAAEAAPVAEPTPEAPPPAEVADEPPVAEAEPAPIPAAPEEEPPPEWDGALPAFAEPDAALDPEMAALIDAADPDRGRSYAQRCTGCHSFQQEGPPARGPEQGPILFGVAGGRIGAAPGFDYSPVFVAMHDARAVWTDAALDAFLADPLRAAPGTAMDVGAVPNPEDRANVIAFLSTLQPETGIVGGDPELLARIGAADPEDGELLVTARCAGCHRFSDDVAHLNGPNLFGIVGAPIGGAADFTYSPALAELNADGAVWTGTRLDAFIENPAVAIPGTRMGFGGIADENERAAIIAYLRNNAETVLPLAAEDPDILLGLGVYQPELNRLAFSTGQSRAGDRYYFEAACDACHGPSMRGTDPAPGQDGAPALYGEEFAANWFGGNLFELYDFIYFHGATDFQDAVTTAITAYILERNGFQPGRTDMPIDREGMEAMGFYQ